MVDARDPAIDELLAIARAEYARSLPIKAADLASLVASRAWNQARRAAHKIRGSAGAYGFPELGEAAGTLEDLLLGIRGAPDMMTAGRIREKLAAVLAEAERGARGST
jgi:HPt (histidine-containing phosphotransfer) domain-containing protein